MLSEDDLWRAGGICMPLVEVCGLALVARIGDEADHVLEVVRAVVEHRLAQCQDDHLQDTPLVRLLSPLQVSVNLHLRLHKSKVMSSGRAHDHVGMLGRGPNLMPHNKTIDAT